MYSQAHLTLPDKFHKVRNHGCVAVMVIVCGSHCWTCTNKSLCRSHSLLYQQNSLRISLVGSCDRRLLTFISAPTNSSCARSLGAPQWHSTCRPVPANSMCWHVQPLSNARPDDRSPASTCTLPELVLRVNTVLAHTPEPHKYTQLHTVYFTKKCSTVQ